MQSCNVFRYDFVRIHRLVQYITDTFRMTSMQGENLDWDTIEGKAQVSVERCNRSCKTNTPIPFSPRVNLSQSINAKTFRKILEMPALNATTLMQSCQDHDLFFTAARWTVSKTICKFPFPFFCSTDSLRKYSPNHLNRLTKHSSHARCYMSVCVVTSDIVRQGQTCGCAVRICPSASIATRVTMCVLPTLSDTWCVCTATTTTSVICATRCIFGRVLAAS